MAVNTALAAPAEKYPTETRIATVGTTWQAVAPPIGRGAFAWTVSADAAIYASFGTEADDAAAIGTHARNAISANTTASWGIPEAIGARAHLLVAAQSGTANVTIGLVKS